MCPCFTTLALVALLIGLIYLFLVWNFGYWKRRGIREMKSYPVTGSFISQFTQKRNVTYDFDDFYRANKRTENFVGVFAGREPMLMVLSPEYMHKVYVNDFKSFHDNEFARLASKKDIMGNNPFLLRGEEWKERRAEITPGLTAHRVAAAYPVSLKIVKAFSEYIRKQSKMAPPEGIEAKKLCLRFTTEVVSDCVLGIKADSLSDNPTPIYEMIQKAFDQSYFFIIYMALSSIVPQLRNIYLPPFFGKDTQKFFIDLMESAIDLRRKTGISDRVDFLNYMLQLQEKKNLSTDQLTAHTMTFLTDGFETTASVLAHTMLLLGRNQEAQEKLRNEIGNDELSFEKLHELPYLDACFQESLRIFPPLLTGRKICTEPYEFVNKDGTKVQVTREQVVLLPIYSVHHDPDIYEQPEEYKPERFLEENGGVRKYREMGAFFGFGDGPRICTGMRFALTQIKAGLVEIVRNFDIKVNPKTRKDNELDDVYFMSLLKGGLWLNFEERK